MSSSEVVTSVVVVNSWKSARVGKSYWFSADGQQSWPNMSVTSHYKVASIDCIDWIPLGSDPTRD